MADGAKVMISSRKEKNVSETLAELRGGEATTTSEIDGMVCHVGKAEHRQALIDRTLEKFGGIDILVSNAGTNPTFGPILNVSSLKNIKSSLSFGVAIELAKNFLKIALDSFSVH